MFLKADQQTILVTGANGQLGSELQLLASLYPLYQFIFVSREELAIENTDAVSDYFSTHPINFCINCAAYTAVDKAESEKELALLINGKAVGNLAAVCKIHHTQFIHISTDYIFNGTNTLPYKETDVTNPVNFYGQTKLKGEELALKNNPETIIIRTSWLYSPFKLNFVKTMLRLMKERDSIAVVDDQVGSPTYAADLAKAIMKIIDSNVTEKAGIYHYTNTGVTSWFQFANAIKELSGSNCIVNPISTAGYPTAAKRPHYSVLDTAKIVAIFQVSIPTWEESLEKCVKLLNNTGL